MKHISAATGLLLMVLVASVASPMPGHETEVAGSDWWQVPYPKPFDDTGIEYTLSFIQVMGKHFVDDQGRTMIFRGVNISDPDKLAQSGHWSKQHFAVIKSWGANIVRVPVHPVAWKGRGTAEYFKLLDQAVVWATELELYLIIEWHAIGNLATGVFQHAMYETSLPETYSFWRALAFRYSGVPTIAFYELFNEPTTFNGQLGTITWQQWKQINEQMIGIIFAHDRQVIPLVAGFNWAYELRSVIENPIAYDGIGYVTHPYPMKALPPWLESWERDFGHVADTYPLIATEIGFMAADDPGAHAPVIGNEEYGRTIIDYFNRKGISWTAWCFDPDWSPQLITDWDYTPTAQGAFFHEVMQLAIPAPIKTKRADR